MRSVVALGVTMLVLGAACTASVGTALDSAPPVEAPLPRIDGRVVYGRPIDSAPSAVGALWESFEAFRAARLPQHEGGGLSAIQVWAEGPFTSFLSGHHEALEGLTAQARSVAAGEDVQDRLFAILVLAAAHDFFWRLFEDVPTPTEISDDEELLGVYREALAQGAAPLARLAADRYGECVDLAAHVEPPLDAWRRECEQRAATLRAAVDGLSVSSRAPAFSPASPPRPIDWPAECAAPEPWPEEVEAPPPTAPLGEITIAVLYRGDRVPASAVPDFLSALRERIGEQTTNRVVSAAEVERAAALRADHRLRRDGQRCGQPPPLGWVLASTRPNLVIAEAYTECPVMPSEPVDHCRLEVRFRRPGSESTALLPASLFAAVTATGDAHAWISAAAQLTGREVPLGGGSIGVLHQQVPVEVRAVGAAASDPWLRVAQLLSDANDAFDGCTPPEATRTRSFDVSWQVSATGAPSDVAVRPRSNADEAAAACVQRVLRGRSWPCTPANRSQRVALTLCLGRPDVRAMGDAP